MFDELMAEFAERLIDGRAWFERLTGRELRTGQVLSLSRVDNFRRSVLRGLSQDTSYCEFFTSGCQCRGSCGGAAAVVVLVSVLVSQATPISLRWVWLARLVAVA